MREHVGGRPGGQDQLAELTSVWANDGRDAVPRRGAELKCCYVVEVDERAQDPLDTTRKAFIAALVARLGPPVYSNRGPGGACDPRGIGCVTIGFQVPLELYNVTYVYVADDLKFEQVYMHASWQLVQFGHRVRRAVQLQGNTDPVEVDPDGVCERGWRRRGCEQGHLFLVFCMDV